MALSVYLNATTGPDPISIQCTDGWVVATNFVLYPICDVKLKKNIEEL